MLSENYNLSIFDFVDEKTNGKKKMHVPEREDVLNGDYTCKVFFRLKCFLFRRFKCVFNTD